MRRRPQFSWRSFRAIWLYTVMYDLTRFNPTPFSRFKSIDTCRVINWHPYIGNGMDNKLLAEKKVKQVIVWWVHQKMPIHCLNYYVAFFGRGQKPAATQSQVMTLSIELYVHLLLLLLLLHINWFVFSKWSIFTLSVSLIGLKCIFFYYIHLTNSRTSSASIMRLGFWTR